MNLSFFILFIKHIMERTRFNSFTSNGLASLKVFPNQDAFGKRIANAFRDRTTHSVLALALTQSGKTGAMIAAAKYFTSIHDIALPIQHIFIITGHSSKDWLSQTRERFPPSLHHNIFHRNTLHQFVLRIKSLHNIIIFIDETQIASHSHQSIQSAFLQADCLHIDSILRKDIKFVFVTATPNKLIHKFIPSQIGFNLVRMNPAPGYTSIFKINREKRLFQSKDLCGFDKVTQLINPAVLDNIREIKLGPIPKYHIIRTHHSFKHLITIDNFKSVFGPKCSYLSMPSLDILYIKPSIHTFIFIKDTLRCASTIHKHHIGVLYERFSFKQSLSSIIQGLAGRATGYHSFPIVVFSQLKDIYAYYAFWTY